VVAFQRLASSLRGLLWLVRGGGLRANIQNLDGHIRRVDEHVDVVLRRPPDVPPQMAEVQAAVAHIIRNIDALRLELAADRPQIQALGGRLNELAEGLAQVRQELRGEARSRQKAAWQRDGDLRGFEFSAHSQNGEDGILQEIFRRVGTTNRYFVEFGVETGDQCNCAYLARDKGWAGLFMEAGESEFEKLKQNYNPFPGIRCCRAMVSSANIEELLAAHQVPAEPDLLSIDIDGNDYWVWKAIRNWRPRVVVAEYNPFHLPPKKWVMKEDPTYVWKRTTYFGASLASLTLLGREKGYTLVGTDSMGVNAFFVRDDALVEGRFLDPVLAYHFTPFGHNAPAPFDGPFEAI
jgi:hypothetical protein